MTILGSTLSEFVILEMMLAATLIAPLLPLTYVPPAAHRGFISRACTLRARSHSPVAMVPVNLLADVASTLPPEAFELPADNLAVLDVVPTVAFTIAGIYTFFRIQAKEEEDTTLRPGHGVNVPEDGGVVPKSAVTLKNFGWLHADLRMPLPTLKELEGACHLIG